MHALSPFLVGNADDRNVLDVLMGPEQRLYLRRIDIFAAGYDHVALAIDEMDVPIRVAPGEIANRAIFAPERLPGLARQLPITIEGMRIARIEFSRLSLPDVVAVLIEQLDRRRADALATDRPQPGELLIGMQHRNPAGFRGTIELEQTGIPEKLH